jgi:hypothetical protein
MWIKYATTYENGVSKLETAPILGLGIYTDYAIQIANEGNEKLKRKFGINSDYQLRYQKIIPRSTNESIEPFDISDDRRMRRWW